MSSLTSKQQVFIAEYLQCWNASEAARLAGYNGKANVVGPRLLANVSIKAEIQARITEKTMTADEVLVRLAEQARVNIGEFFTEEGLAVNSQKVKQKGHLVKSLTWTQYGPKLELHDAQSALVNLGKHHGLFTDKIEIKLTKEVERILSIIEGALDADSYQRVLQAIVNSGEGGAEETQPITESQEI